MELVQHEDVHSRQASVLTFKCSLSKDGQWMRSRSDCDPQMYSPRRVYLLNSTWITELNIWELRLSRDVAWTFILGCMLLICIVICNIIRLLWVGVVAHCVDIYHVLGVYTELAALTSAPKSVAGARPHFSSSVDDVDDHVNQWLRFTCSHSYHVYEAYSSRCGLALKRPPPSLLFHTISRCILKL